MKIQYVPQKHETGCVIACMAMVTGFDYDKIAKQFFTTDFDKEGLHADVTRNYVCDYGFGAIEVLAHNYGDIRASNLRMQRPFADVHIVSVSPTPNCAMNHAVVMDKRGRVYDPGKPKFRDFSNYYFICRVLGFFDERQKRR